ncbi:apolipoprotein N-acyltransferase [Flavihumibacter stibioxidans]|uniref:Apolipoprotein N-acyltransferase n=1 Tax=Flavihumibacter stibioxidans TaxID=1834163 RepID=A0ABR7MBU8_9BACT|nr:apolipoprotein N-acyltransferase [Flavihumibacter stibioxidans]MBC6492522.1 apolipoprotein N-acyltransferase [Flavihumibacter stibioxidans]
MKKFPPFILALATGLLLAASWPPLPTTFLIFVAFIPLFYFLEQEPGKWKFLGWAFFSMLTWNATTTWWIWNSTGPGSVAAIITNSLFMILPWLALYNVHKRLGGRFSYWAFLACWMTFEYIHLNWELSWPWLTLGNAFADHPEWVQWYQFTGTSGGSLWVLFINVILFQQINAVSGNRKLLIRSMTWFMLAAVGIPMAVSLMVKAFNMRLDARVNNKPKKNIVVVQPNIDPYQKFGEGTQDVQINQLIRLSETMVDSNTALVVWPETAINLPGGIEEDSIRKYSVFKPVWDFLHRHPQLKLLSGIEGYRIYRNGGQSEYARPITGTGFWYDTYNTAALLDSSGILYRYHKSKLVPGVEALPSFLRFLGSWFEQFGGTTGGYAKQEERTVLPDEHNGLRIAPAICYESIYGDFLTGFQRNGANIIAVITNDGWWGNTSGHKQHLAYARLRAIETRRWVVRSANTGISAFIDPYGTVLQAQPWDTAAAIKQVIQPNAEQTFYARFGDWISKIMVALAIVLVGYSTYTYFTGRKKAVL